MHHYNSKERRFWNCQRKLWQDLGWIQEWVWRWWQRILAWEWQHSPADKVWSKKAQGGAGGSWWADSLGRVWHIQVNFSRIKFYKINWRWQQTRVEGEDQDYLLHIGNYSGTAGDSFNSLAGDYTNDGMKFSTKDRDNDNAYGFHCAQNYRGGWWHSGLVTKSKSMLIWSAVYKRIILGASKHVWIVLLTKKAYIGIIFLVTTTP